MCWAKETRCSPIADIMHVNDIVRENIHVSNNLEQDNPENIGKKLYEIQPVLDHVQEIATNSI